MVSALYYARRGNESELSLLLKLLYRYSSTVTHSGLNLVERLLHVIVKRTCIGYVGVNALLKGKLCSEAMDMSSMFEIDKVVTGENGYQDFTVRAEFIDHENNNAARGGEVSFDLRFVAIQAIN